MICILQSKQLQVLQNKRSHHWVSSTARCVKSSNHKILRKLNVTYWPGTLMEELLAKSTFLDEK